MSAWDWSHGSVVAGANVTVRVEGAPCENVKVTLFVNGVEVDTDEIARPPGSVRLSVPEGTTGQPYEIKVSCDSQSDSQSGTVM
jgi:hypothetical protein